MNTPSISNIYQSTTLSVRELYGQYLQASGNELLLAISQKPLSFEALHALRNTAQALGYGTDGIGFIWCGFDEGAELGPEDLRPLIESLDPTCLILCDRVSCEAISSAYRSPLYMDRITRILGRAVASFESLEEMLGSPGAKQHAWRILKQLPKLAC